MPRLLELCLSMVFLYYRGRYGTVRTIQDFPLEASRTVRFARHFHVFALSY